jgi:CrcB protein
VATFAVNIAGAFILGLAITLLQERMRLTAYRRPLVGTGLVTSELVPTIGVGARG